MQPSGSESSAFVTVGWGRAEFTPSKSVPLAGYTHPRDRMSEKVRDPLFARAVVIRTSDGRTVALVVWDLLIITEDIHQGMKSALAGEGIEPICSATHTHSSVGGFWNSLLGRFFMGRFRPGTTEMLVDAGVRAVRMAAQSMGPAAVRTAHVDIPGLNGNRRDPEGPLDERLTVIRFERDGADAVLFSYPGHPVIVAERDHHVLSADFPGDAVARLEKQFDFAMFVQGPLGGVDVRFPKDPVSVDRNIEMMAGPIANTTASLARGAESLSAAVAVGYSIREIPFGRPASCWSYGDDRRRGDFILDALATSLAAPVPRVGRIQGLRIGDTLLCGFPADLGIGLSLDIRRDAESAGFVNVITMSETGGCVGYVHRPQDYEKTPKDTGESVTMGRYENAMNFFGRDTGAKFRQAALEVIRDLVEE